MTSDPRKRVSPRRVQELRDQHYMEAAEIREWLFQQEWTDMNARYTGV